MTDLFFGDESDLRDEIGREERESIAKSICLGGCKYRFACLQYALLNNEKFGVWGGMSPGERREFKIYLRKQGYVDLPSGRELRLAVNIYEGHDGARPESCRNGDRPAWQRRGEMAVDRDEAAG